MSSRILLVEDNDELREAHTTILEILGYKFESASSGQEAWETCQDNNFDLIISDITMPQGNGLWFLEKLKSSKLPAAQADFFLCSGYATWSEEELKQKGAKGLLKKPYDLVSFLESYFSP